MPRHNDFNFDLYRLTIHDDESLLPFMGERIRSNAQIVSVLQTACHAPLDLRQETSSAIYQWSLRDFTELPSEEQPGTMAYAITLAKATIEKDGVILTPETVQAGTSISQPPPADVVSLIFQMDRHLVAVEIKSTVTSGQGWLHALHDILRRAASQRNFTSTIELQTKPTKSERHSLRLIPQLLLHTRRLFRQSSIILTGETG